MPYLLATPRTFNVSKETPVSITRLRVIEYAVKLEPAATSHVMASLQSGSGPYADETVISYHFNADSTMRILATNNSGTTRAGQALEKGIFDELARLNVIPAGTTS
jgi:hypothetical protein